MTMWRKENCAANRKRKRRKAKGREKKGRVKREDVKTKCPKYYVFPISEMSTPEGKVEYRCEVGGCTAKYTGFTWYQKHLKTKHFIDLERSAWEASVNESQPKQLHELHGKS